MLLIYVTNSVLNVFLYENLINNINSIRLNSDTYRITVCFINNVGKIVL